jgi:Protein of unknown function (DUF3396)
MAMTQAKNLDTLEKSAAWFDANPLPLVKLFDDDEGRIPGRVGIVMTLYFEEQRGLQQRQNLIEIVKRFRNWVGPENLGWWAGGYTNRMQFDKKKKLDFDQLQEKMVNPNLHFDLPMSSVDAGGDDVQEVEANAQRFLLKIDASPRNIGVGYIHMHLPLGWTIKQPPETSAAVFFASCAQLVQALHGTLGVGVCLPSRDMFATEKEYAYAISELVHQSPGLIAQRADPLFLSKGLGAISWLTMVRDHWLEKLGGRDAVKAQLPPPVLTYDLPSGLIIQAGEEPQLKLIDPEPYRMVARVLKPLRVQAGNGIYANPAMYTAETRYDTARFLLDCDWYLSRFD